MTQSGGGWGGGGGRNTFFSATFYNFQKSGRAIAVGPCFVQSLHSLNILYNFVWQKFSFQTRFFRGFFGSRHSSAVSLV